MHPTLSAAAKHSISTKHIQLFPPMQLHQFLAVLWLGAAAMLFTVGALPQPSSNCKRKCGEVDIPYPFGIEPDDSPDHCAMPGFNLRCNDTGSRPFVSFMPYLHHVDVLSISLLQGQARMLNHISSACYNTTSQKVDYADWEVNFTNTPYRFSDTSNRFTAIGCQTLAYIRDYDNMGKYMSGCVAMCHESDVMALTNGSCSGIGCCQTAIPKGLQYYRVWFEEKFKTMQTIYKFSPCSYAVLMDSSDFSFQMSYVTSKDFNNTNGGQHPLVIDWAIGNESCEVASEKHDSYACVSKNSECVDSPNGPGYFCNCSKGYEGNPYLEDSEQGCKDINECEDHNKYPCYGRCHNREGGFDCLCPPGTQGNASTGPCLRELNKGARIAIGICASLFFVLPIILVIELIKYKRRIIIQDDMRKRDAYFRQHGGQLLTDMMKIESNICFKLYCREEIELATNNFDSRAIIGEGCQGIVYKGHDLDPENNPVAVKRCKGLDENRMTEFGQELLILSRVTHKNIVKILGCSLQFEAPILVYEFVPNNTLHYLIHVQHDASIRTLEIRLKIAAESAEALAHLHTLSHPIFHGDVKSANILLGHDLSAKVSDFGCSMIWSAEENLKGVKGTMGYLDPEYLMNFQLTDKSDVYSFGVILLELITRRKALSKVESLVSVFKEATKECKLGELIDREIDNQENMEFIIRVATLAGQCLVMTGEDRLTMRQVAEELGRLVGPLQQRTRALHGVSPYMVQELSFTNTSNDYTDEETTDYNSLKKKAAMSIEFAR